jgi:hypothetical protein
MKKPRRMVLFWRNIIPKPKPGHKYWCSLPKYRSKPELISWPKGSEKEPFSRRTKREPSLIPAKLGVDKTVTVCFLLIRLPWTLFTLLQRLSRFVGSPSLCHLSLALLSWENYLNIVQHTPLLLRSLWPKLRFFL